MLTGLKPTATPHLGNYVGAIRPAQKLAQDPANRVLFLIADAHAVTTATERRTLIRLTQEATAAWLACSVDSERTLILRQSDIPEIFELAWLLACVTAKGWMNRAHAYKAAVASNRERGAENLDAGVNLGLYSYPVLMAADIVLFGADLVSVGADQLQHVEITRDIVARLNDTHDTRLSIPQALPAADAVVPGIDGRKMSKSYGNTIPLFAQPEAIHRAVSSIVTDSSPVDVPKVPETSTIFRIYREFARPEQTRALAARYGQGIGWGEAKAMLAALLDETLSEPRERFRTLMAEPQKISAQLERCAREARELARPRLERVRQAFGLYRRLHRSG